MTNKRKVLKLFVSIGVKGALCLVCLTAVGFALFDWYQTAQPLLGIYSRYLCIIGSLGATIIGASLAREGIRLRKNGAGKHSKNGRKIIP